MYTFCTRMASESLGSDAWEHLRQESDLGATEACTVHNLSLEGANVNSTKSTRHLPLKTRTHCCVIVSALCSDTHFLNHLDTLISFSK